MTHELLLSRVGGLVWAAVRHDGRTVELHAERREQPPAAGRIVKARVTRVVPSIQAAFVDLGDDQQGFVPADQLADPGGESRPLQERLREGSELLVQISRETVESKAHRATGRLVVPGRRLVLRAAETGHLVSRRIRDAEERARLLGVLGRVDAAGGSFIARTAAGGASIEELETEAAALRARLDGIRRRAATSAAPAAVAEAAGLAARLVLDAPPEGWACVVVDTDEDEATVREALDGYPGAVRALRRHEGPGTVYDGLGLRDEIERALRPRVWLPSGGRITIEQTEALVAIDVDSGRAIRGSDPRATALGTNTEAASEIARQLRLRGLGGIVVIDFIDMGHDEDRRQLADVLGAALRDDPSRTRLAPPGEFGLMQLTRRRTRADLETTLRRRCADCEGQGRERRADVVAAEALAEWLSRDGAARGLPIRLAPQIAAVAHEQWPAAARRAMTIDETLPRRGTRVGDGPLDENPG